MPKKKKKKTLSLSLSFTFSLTKIYLAYCNLQTKGFELNC